MFDPTFPVQMPCPNPATGFGGIWIPSECKAAIGHFNEAFLLPRRGPAVAGRLSATESAMWTTRASPGVHPPCLFFLMSSAHMRQPTSREGVVLRCLIRLCRIVLLQETRMRVFLPRFSPPRAANAPPPTHTNRNLSSNSAGRCNYSYWVKMCFLN